MVRPLEESWEGDRVDVDKASRTAQGPFLSSFFLEEPTTTGGGNQIGRYPPSPLSLAGGVTFLFLVVDVINKTKIKNLIT
jgi:hypothetical protein